MIGSRLINLIPVRIQVYNIFVYYSIYLLDNSSTYNRDSFINDQTLPLSNVFSNNSYLTQVKSSLEIDDTITALLLPDL
jgi:hypothetical protein